MMIMLDLELAAAIEIVQQDNVQDLSESLEYELACFSLQALPSDKEWAEEQQKDAMCWPIIRWLNHKELPDDRELRLTFL
jgi:hypothetical protein